MDYRHVALFVSDLRAAEDYYARVFDMEVIGRESFADDGNSYALRPDKGWDDAIAAGVELSFVALRRDNFILALLKGDPQVGQLFALGLVTDEGAIAEIVERVDPNSILGSGPTFIEFFDPFGIRWQVSDTRDFLHAGQIADRWLDV